MTNKKFDKISEEIFMLATNVETDMIKEQNTKKKRALKRVHSYLVQAFGYVDRSSELIEKSNKI